MTRRGGFKFHAPLSRPDSERVELCYGSHGKAKHRDPAIGSELLILAIDPDCLTRWERGSYPESHVFVCPALQKQSWRRLGWVMAGGSLPLGELEAIDPTMAQFEFLPPAHTELLGTGRYPGATK
jgi:hypothetical protein